MEPGRLRFLQLDEWDEHNSYSEDVPTCLHYSIEWKVAVNNKVVHRDTEQDVVLIPIGYWHTTLRLKLERVLERKFGLDNQMRCDDTNVTVSVTDRTQRDLVKSFENLNIDWPTVAKQLEEWGERLRSGKKLRVDLCFNYVDSHLAAGPGAGPAQRGNKRGASATQRMLNDRAMQLDAEQEATGNPSIWRDVYTLMQCPGSPCDLGQYCWRDSFGKKHYKLRTHHLKALVEFVERGNLLRDHDDIPEEIREQLMLEERQRQERQAKSSSTTSTPNYPPITITNVLPQSHQSPSVNAIEATPAPVVRLTSIACLEIPGSRDRAVREYSEWQQSKVDDDMLKEEFRRACDVALQDGLDLEQVYQDQDAAFFIKNGVKRGVARRFISDIESWAKRYKLSCDGNMMTV
jgi:hypothetical protein